MFKSTIAFLFLFLLSFNCFAQQNEIAYLDNLIEKNKTITNEIILEKAFSSELKQAKSDDEKNNIEIVYAVLLANLKFKKLDIVTPEVDSIYKSAISKASASDKNLIIWANTEYGFYLYTNSLYKDALPYFLSASRLMERNNAIPLIQNTEVLKKNSFFFGSIEDYARSTIYVKKALEVTDKKSFDYGALLNNLGNNYRKTGNTILAEKYFNETLELSKNNNDKVRYAKALGDLALLYQLKNDWQKAEEYLLKDIAISKEYKSERNVMYAQIQLGNLYYKTNKLQKALAVLNEAENYATSKSNLKGFEQEIAQVKLAIAVKQNDTKAELEQRRKLEITTWHVSKTDGPQVINRLNLETQNENIKLQLLAEKVKAENDSLVTKMSVIIGVILFFLLILIFIMNKRKLKYQQIDFDQKIVSFQIDKLNSESKLKETNTSLVSYKTYLIEKNEQIKKLEAEIAKNDNSVLAAQKKEVFKQLLDSHLLTEDNWLNFKNEFIKEQNDFYETTIQKYPNLTESNLRLIMLIKMGLTNQNIANLLGVTLDAVKKAKQRLKKKYEDILKELE